MGTVIFKVEKVFEETFGGLTISGQDDLNFGYGDERELDAIIVGKSMNQKKAYPLLWYKMPNNVTNNPLMGYCEGSFTFILAHNTKLDWFNDQRFENVYEAILYPYLEEILKAIGKSNRISSEDGAYSSTNYPNYSKSITASSSERVDYWDAIELNIDLKINNGINC